MVLHFCPQCVDAKRPVIDKFRLLLGWFHEKGRREAGDDIRMCLRFALDKQAKEIHFSDISSELTNSSDFPNFTSQSLVTLELCHCCIYPQLQVNLGSLKKLLFWHTEMSEEAFQQFISGCPSLEELHIIEPYDIKKLRFSAPNIRRLSLVLLNDEDTDEDTDDPWLFDFPNLISLDLELRQIPNVINVSSVRDVYLKQLLFNMDDANEIRRFNIFLEKFSCIEDFKLSLYASEPFFHSIVDSHLLQIRWKRAVLRLHIFCQSCLLGFYQLMRSSIRLEELIIHTTRVFTCYSVCKASVDLPPVELSNPCVMPKLTTVTLHGYAKPGKHQLQLVEFLLKSAPVLEELVIVSHKTQLTVKEKLEKLDFVMHVSSLQRSSTSARVLFL